MPNSEEDFWSNFAPEGGCLVWQRGCNENGYGIAYFGGRQHLSHRLAWQLRHGPIPAGKKVLHSCDNPPCGLDEHLRLGTQADNAQDREQRGRGNIKRIGTRRRYTQLPIRNLAGQFTRSTP
jgi:hypothetical protein